MIENQFIQVVVNFFSPVTYNGYTMESHCDRNRSIKLLDDLFKKLKLEFSLIEV